MKSLLKYCLILVLCFELTSCKNGKINKTHPNIIFVMTDDQGYGDLGYNGNTEIKTPHIDAFASQSLNFTNYHVGTTCSPTRAGLMTARNCLRNGVWHTNAGCSLLNQEEETIADIFSNAGYKTAMFGKWHLGDNYSFLPEQRGFQETFYHKGGGVGQTPDYWGNDYNNGTYFRNGVPEKTRGYCTDVFFDEALLFIKKNKDTPFFCYLSLNAPHSPFNVPEKYYQIYSNKDNLLESQKRFYGMISNIDDNFGKLLNNLESLELTENTIVVFTTDNGTSNGYRYVQKDKKWYGYNADMRGTKTSEYDGGHRVPMIMQWKNKGLSNGKLFEGLSAHVDMLPTLAKFAGIPFKPKKMIDGIDLTNYIQNGKDPMRMLVTDTQRNLWPKKDKKSCVMYSTWRLINGTELYDVAKDPGQKINVINEFPEIAKQMMNFYSNWWDDASMEFRYSYIDILPQKTTILTAHDVHVKSITAWSQKDIRSGNPFETGNFYIDVKKAGKYEIILRRWPIETGLHLNAKLNDYIPPTPYWDEVITGNSMDISNGKILINDSESITSNKINNSGITFNVEMDSGKQTLAPMFNLKNGDKTVAFFTEISYQGK
jgi:arylsulfatase A-like enzyme